MAKYYFTFGTDPAYPYGIEEFVIVYAKNITDAIAKFRKKYPNRPGSPCVNCADWYTEDDWNKHVSHFYDGRNPADEIG